MDHYIERAKEEEDLLSVYRLLMVKSVMSQVNLTLSLPESNLESINVLLTFKSVDKTLVCVTIQMKAIE